MTTPDPAIAPPSAPAVVSARAIVFVPGMQRGERHALRDALARGLCVQELVRVERGSDVSIGGEVGVRLVGKEAGSRPELHVFEAYWADMFADQTPTSPWARLAEGLKLVLYWMHVRMLRALRVSRYMTLGLFGGGLVLVLWYLSTVTLAAQAISSDKSWQSSVPSWLGESVVQLGSTIGGWKLWMTVTMLLPFLRADDLARMASFAKRYFQNSVAGSSLGLRERLRERVRATLDRIADAGYREVTVLAHSFGTIVALDILADWKPSTAGPAVRLVTWGSPAAVMQHRSEWLQTEIPRLLQNAELSHWVDVYSDTDWLCSAFPDRQKSPIPGGTSRIRFESSFLERALGRTHLEYYTSPDALAPLLHA